MAQFNGVDMGLNEEFITSPNPKEAQIDGYPGVNGISRLDMGARGGTSRVRGVVAGVDEYDLASIHQVFYDLQDDGGAYDLEDANGVVWTDVVLVSYRPSGPRYPLGDDGIAQRYEAEFLHL